MKTFSLSTKHNYYISSNKNWDSVKSKTFYNGRSGVEIEGPGKGRPRKEKNTPN